VVEAPMGRLIHLVLMLAGVSLQVVMLKRIALSSALAASLMAVMSTAAISQPRGTPRPFAPFDWDPAPEEDSAPEPEAPQSAPANRPENKNVRLQAPGASDYSPSSSLFDTPSEQIGGEIRSRLNSVLSSARGTHAEDAAALTAFYSGRNSLPIWTNNSGLTRRAAAAMTEIRRADEWGLSTSAFTLPEPDGAEPSANNLASADVKLSLAVLKYARHARGGRIDYSEAIDLIDFKSNVYEPKSTLQAIAAADSPDAFLRSLHPRHEGFRRLREALLGMDKATASAPQDRDQERGRKGGKSKASSPDDERRRIIVNMERWRLLPDDLGEFYVWNSIAEQHTRVYDHGRMVLKERIVVGKPKTPTPIFSAKMQFVVFHPEWGVPDSIKLNELAPKLREASGGGGGDARDEGDGPSWLTGRRRGGGGGGSQVLERMNLKVTIEGREVNPDSVDWSNVDIRRYQFVQPSGERNALGLIKFRFPNKHDVYMHDTPDRKLFANATRTYSHGCMRTQNPAHLAEVVLSHDRNFSADDVKKLLAERTGKPKEIKLNNPIPVYVTYFTMDTDEEGKLRTLPDVYGEDKLITAALNGEPLRFSLKSHAEAVADAGSRNSGYRNSGRRDPYGDSGYRDSRSRSQYQDSPSGRRQPPPDDSSSGDTWSSGRWDRLDRLFGR
jgi:L,D-transpeptidase YcbB